ncbi:uncharacterized protein LOC132865712 [Neoarius graeffei]|uniref:uncharacterized protein LOC132865712 n=1 Tax=Neoarius graeffei TaxID=443677 RepID=UPI00298C11AE|nr:uncharacterized protein LOC132865712 [Neoarius graeffei]
MAQIWKVVEFQDRSAAVVSSSWVVDVDGEVGCYWPPFGGNKAVKAAMNCTPLGQGWRFHQKIRVLATCGTFAKARCYLTRSLEEGYLTADLQSDDGEMGPRKRRPNKRYLEEDSEEEAGPSRRGRRPPSIDATQLDSFFFLVISRVHPPADVSSLNLEHPQDGGTAEVDQASSYYHSFAAKANWTLSLLPEQWHSWLFSYFLLALLGLLTSSSMTPLEIHMLLPR